MVELELIVGVSVLIALIFVAIVAVYATRYKKVPPDAAMILYGREYAKGRGYEVWTGGGKFIIPIVESYRFLPVGIRALDVIVDEIVTNVVGSGAKGNIKAGGEGGDSSGPD